MYSSQEYLLEIMCYSSTTNTKKRLPLDFDKYLHILSDADRVLDDEVQCFSDELTLPPGVGGPSKIP